MTTIVKFALRVVVLAVIMYLVTQLVSGITVEAAGTTADRAGT